MPTLKWILPPLLCALLPLTAQAHQDAGHSHVQVDQFQYDRADREVETNYLVEEFEKDSQMAEAYDADIVDLDGQLWATWIGHDPEEGEVIRVSKIKDGKAIEKGLTIDSHWRDKGDADTNDPVGVRFSRPQLHASPDGQLYLGYETMQHLVGNGIRKDAPWSFVVQNVAEENATARFVWQELQGDVLNVAMAVGENGEIWLAAQINEGGQFAIKVVEVDFDVERLQKQSWIGLPREGEVVSSPNGGNAWAPSIALTEDGTVCVAWDAHNGDNYDVWARRFVDGRWLDAQCIAAKPNLEARADVVADAKGRFWILWEEGSTGWGHPYRGNAGRWTNMTDTYGPLHRFRRLRLACIDTNGKLMLLDKQLPQPSLDMAAKREGRWEGVQYLGAFYERGRLAVDHSGRIWVFYRHYYRPQLGTEHSTKHHIETGSRVYARCIGQRGVWSELLSFDQHQRDGTQRLSITPSGDGIAAIWSAGRTDRRKDGQRRGVVLAKCVIEKGSGLFSRNGPKGASQKRDLTPFLSLGAPIDNKPIPSVIDRSEPATTQVGGKTYHLVHGDLHRHTDLSLCFPFFDGSIDDAYRYSIDVARMDFLGITDHTRDIDNGQVGSQLWRRCMKAADRYRLPGKFFPYYSYERSHGETDHNVISLRDDMLRNFPPPLREFWDEITDNNTFTIPHEPINATRTWAHQDDAKRPLLEIYQGCRDNPRHSEPAANVGLRKGYHLGFIASSDHMSTSASYACVWTETVAREPIFRAMQSRRTFGATDHISLIFKCGDAWMGEIVKSETLPEYQLEIVATGPIVKLEAVMDGRRIIPLPFEEGATEIKTSFTAPKDYDGKHYIYIYMEQADGNRAWSSPLWVTFKNPNPSPASVLARKFKSGGLVNVARDKPVSVSFADEITIGKPAMVTDGEKQQFLGHGLPPNKPGFVTVDLEKVEPLEAIWIWHYYRDGRAYSGNRVELSETGRFEGEEIVVFDSATDGMYSETAAGKILAFEQPIPTRYIRNHLIGNAINGSRQWTEIEAYAAP